MSPWHKRYAILYDRMVRIVSIDIGYVNMAMVGCTTTEEGVVDFDYTAKVDITHVMHNRVNPCDCKIPHTNETCDRVMHFIQEYRPVFDEADIVLIERQPPMGLKDVEALITQTFRSKVQLISPNKMHKFWGISRYDYERRKEHTERIASEYVDLSLYERKHDVADAVCIAMFYIKTHYKPKPKRLPFDEFRFDQSHKLVVGSGLVHIAPTEFSKVPLE